MNIFITVILKSSSCGSAILHFSVNTVGSVFCPGCCGLLWLLCLSHQKKNTVLDVVDCVGYGVYHFKTKHTWKLVLMFLHTPCLSVNGRMSLHGGVSPGHRDGVSRAVLLQ